MASTKSVAIVTKTFIMDEYADGPSYAIIFFDIDDVHLIEKYMLMMDNMKEAGMNPSVVDTHSAPLCMFVDDTFDEIPLDPKVVEKLLFANTTIKGEFLDMFNDDLEEGQEYTTLEELESDTRTDCEKLKVRHDGTIWIDALEKYSGVHFETEGFDKATLEDIKEQVMIRMVSV